jgi:hypothetical protein
MKPEFGFTQQPKPGEELVQANVRIPAHIKTTLEAIAATEGDRSILPLLHEGIARVIMDRFGSDESALKITQELQSQVEQVVAARALVASLQKQPATE